MKGVSACQSHVPCSCVDDMSDCMMWMCIMCIIGSLRKVRLISPHSSLLPHCLLCRLRGYANNGSHQMICAVHKRAITVMVRIASHSPVPYLDKSTKLKNPRSHLHHFPRFPYLFTPHDTPHNATQLHQQQREKNGSPTAF
jgi:hypothetical protein